MTPDLKQAFALLFGAAQQAHLTAAEHGAVFKAAQAIETALTPPPAPDAAAPEPTA